MPDRALRKMVNRLARHSAEDIDAVLAELEPDQRKRVSGMLAGKPQLPERSASENEVVASAQEPNLDPFSPWLAARIKAALAGAGEGRFNGAPFKLAPGAREALLLEVSSFSAPKDSHLETPTPMRRLLQYLRRTAT